jgi:hypothetical protein
MRKYEEINGSTVRYSVSLKIDTPVVSAASYNDFKKLVETAAREDRAQIILTKSESAVNIQHSALIPNRDDALE